MPKVPFWVFVLIAILYFTATRVDIMDIDASQYAEISREMLKKGDYLHVFDRGLEYLDKPPFLFWMSALSMKVFGVTTFAYKLPSILFALFSLFATYRLARLLYNDTVGRMAALVLATCQGMFLMTNDIRCDTILMSCVITSIWLIQEWVINKKLLYLLGGCVAIGIGMMTKGPIALMVPVFCFVTDWILKRQWKNFLQPAYLLGLIVIALILVPMSIGLYQQFDLHPEKLVNGKTGTSGLRFFYWSQSFGRITGENPWKNDVDLSFLFVNMLWSFLPWVFLFIPALVVNVIQLVKQKFRLTVQQEWISTGGFLISYLALGSSAYQLPHYIFVAFPLAAIVVAKFFYELIEEKKYPGLYKFAKPFQATIISLVLFTSLLLIVIVFPVSAIVIIGWAICLVIWLYIAFRKQLVGKLLWLSASGMIFANIFMTNFVYYRLLDYQGGSVVGKYVRSHNIAASNMVTYKVTDAMIALDFYGQDVYRAMDTLADLRQQKYILTMDNGLADLQQKGYVFDTTFTGRLFKVSELTPEFLNPATRDKETKKYYLVHLR